MRCYDWQVACRQPGVVTELYLTEQEWTQLPLEWPFFPALKVLDLSGNALTSLPDLAGNVPQLQRLILARNNFEHWPRAINLLPQLRELDLSYNRLTELTLPPGALPQLRQLDLHHNQLKALELMAPLPALQRLDLSYNRLVALAGIEELLPQLSSLVLRKNRLAEWSLHATSPRLQVLDLGYNRLATLPDLRGNCTYLRQLRLDHNHFSQIPAFVWQLPWLTELDLAHNRLVRINADSDQEAPRLEKLQLAYNQIDQIEQLPASLRWLNLSHNQLRAVPAALQNLHHLRNLELSANLLGTAPLQLPAGWRLDLLGLRGAAPVDLAWTVLNWQKLANLRGGGELATSKILLKLMHWGEKWSRPAAEKWACFLAWRDQSSAPLATLSSTTLVLLENCGIPALVHLARQTWDVAHPAAAATSTLAPGTHLWFLGRATKSLSLLAKRLEGQGIVLSRPMAGSSPTHLVIGKPPLTLPPLAALPAVALPCLTEGQLTQWLAEKEGAFLLQVGPALLEKIKLLLLHQDSNNVQLGLNLLETGGVAREVLPILLVAYLWQPPQSKLRRQALQLLQLHWPLPFAPINYRRIRLPRDPQRAEFRAQLGQLLADTGLDYPDLDLLSPS